MKRLIICAALLILAACSNAPTVPTPALPLGKGPGASYELMYLFRDESVEATQAYQLAGVVTAVSGAQPPQRVLQKFPVDGIAVPWDVRPPAALSPDGHTLALVQWDEKIGRALTVDGRTGAARALPGIRVTGLFTPTVLGWSRDGAQVYFYDETMLPGKVFAFTMSSDAIQPLFTLEDGAPQTAMETLAPDSSALIYCTTIGNRGCAGFALRALVDGARTPVALRAGLVCSGYPALKWSPDGRALALGCIDSAHHYSVELIDPATGAVRSFAMPEEVNDFAWSADSQQLLIDLCAGNYINVGDPDCGPLRLLDVVAGTVGKGPAIERTEARRLYWLGDTLIFNESTGGGQEATMYFYDIPTRQSKQFTRNASTYADASFTVLALRPVS